MLLGRKFQLSFLEHFDELGDGGRLEGAEPVEHLVEDDSQRPDVCFGAVDLSPEDFGRHVDGRPKHGFGHVGLLQAFAEPEISELDDALVEEDVVGFEVAVHDVVLVEDLEGVDELLEDEEGLLFGNDPLLAENALKRASVAVLVDEVEVVGRLEHVDVLDDVLVLLDVRQNVDLVDRALLQLLVLFEPTHLDHLDRVLLVVQLVDSPVHLSVGALPDYLVKGVVLDYPHHPPPNTNSNNYYRPRSNSHPAREHWEEGKRAGEGGGG